MRKKRRTKKIKKPKYPVSNNVLIIILIIVLIFAIFSLSKYFSQTGEKTTTTSTTIQTTITTTSITTIPTIQTCSNFTWVVDDVNEYDLMGNYKFVVVDFTAQYIGLEEEEYLSGLYQFKILDDGGKYYNPQESYFRCEESNTFKIDTVSPGDEISGCLEFRILDINVPKKLLFYDYIVHTMCGIDLS